MTVITRRTLFSNLCLSRRIEIDMEEFEAPQWCVPIKANVMNFDWDVSYCGNLVYHVSKALVN
jgi:hypothetical protein